MKTFETKAFDNKRRRLWKRIRILGVTHGLERKYIAHHLGVDPSYIPHLFSGRRNSALETMIEEIERIVDDFEKVQSSA